MRQSGCYMTFIVLKYDIYNENALSMILDRADQAINVTDVQRRTKVLFDKLENREQDRYVVMRDGKPVFIMIRMVELPGRPLLARADQATTATEVQRNAKEIFDRLQSGQQDRYLVMRDGGRPAVELLSLEAYESLMEDIDMSTTHDGNLDDKKV